MCQPESIFQAPATVFTVGPMAHMSSRLSALTVSGPAESLPLCQPAVVAGAAGDHEIQARSITLKAHTPTGPSAAAA
jgi:hypothetical protein